MRADDGAHGAVAEVGVLQGDPRGTHVGRARALPVAVVLVPADVAGGHRGPVGAYARLGHRLIVPQPHFVHAHEASADGAQQRAGGDGADIVVEPEGVALLAHRRGIGFASGRPILRRNGMIEIACPQPVVGAAQAGDGVCVEQPRTAPVAALAVLGEHLMVDQRVDINAFNYHGGSLPSRRRVRQTRPSPRAAIHCTAPVAVAYRLSPPLSNSPRRNASNPPCVQFLSGAVDGCHGITPVTLAPRRVPAARLREFAGVRFVPGGWGMTAEEPERGFEPLTCSLRVNRSAN